MTATTNIDDSRISRRRAGDADAGAGGGGMKRPPWEHYIPPPTNRRILDNLGITINMRMLEYHPTYSAARVAVFGRGRVRRWWMRHVFPRVKPAEYARRVKDFEEKRAVMQQEFLNAVIERAEAKAK